MMQRPGRILSHGRAILAALFLSVAVSRPALAQKVAIATAEIDDQVQEAPKNTGFSLKKEDSKIIEQIEDFERFRDKKAWDRAFKSLSGVLEANLSNGLAPTKDGFWIPTRQRLMQALIALPPEGREAYRLFNDAKAKQEWDKILAHETAGDADTLPQLKKLVEQYLITTIGDKAADHLGDALMEAGDYPGAAAAYESILHARPDTDLSLLRLQIKLAAALGRGGRNEQFRELAAQIREKHSSETVKLGGKEVSVEEALAHLVEPTTKPASTMPAASNDVAEVSTPIVLPAKGQPAWQHVFMDHVLHDKIMANLNSNGWAAQQMGNMTNEEPSCATDGSRVFLNWFGIIWAVDVQSGKLLWWTSHFNPLSDRINDMAQWQVEQRRFTITVAGDNVLAVALRLDRLNNQEPFRLMCFDPATGKKKWTTESGPLQNWAYIGQPLVVDGVIYAMAHQRNSQEIHLLAMSLADSKQQWEVTLGQPQVGTNWRGMPVYPLPVLKLVGSTMYIMTGNGALLAMDMGTHNIVWAYTYDYVFRQNQQMFWNGMPQEAPIEPIGTAFLREGTLYFKDQYGSAVYAIDLAGPKLLFRRPVEDSQLLAGVNDKGFYLVGSNFSFIDHKTRALLWAPAIPVESSYMKPAVAGEDYLMFTSRGIFKIDPTTQAVEIFRGNDLDSVGGSLLRAGNKLISVSNLCVTAYDVGPAQQAALQHP